MTLMKLSPRRNGMSLATNLVMLGKKLLILFKNSVLMEK